MDELLIVGLGSGLADQLTAAAIRALEAADEIFVDDPTIPALDAFRDRLRVVNFVSPDDQVGAAFLSRSPLPGSTVVGVLGTPGDAPWIRRFLNRRTGKDRPTRIIPGRSLIDALAEAVGLELGASDFQIVSAARLVGAAEGALIDPFLGVYRPIDPVKPCVVAAVDEASAALTERALHAIYPPRHLLSLVRFPLRPDRVPADTLHLDQLSAILGPGDRAWLYLPPLERLEDTVSFDTLRYIVARLRGPGGCPWDREQTLTSLKKYLLEETYEALDALDRAADEELAGELGDVLLQVVMYSQLGREAKEFDLEDVLRAVNEKLVRRHPHVFGGEEIGSAAEVLRNWERIKREEKSAANTAAPVTEGSFGGVPRAAPALIRADAVQSRAARYGWLPPESLPNLSELSQPGQTSGARLRALGDALFTLVAYGRSEHLDAEEALRLATSRFVAAIEQVLAASRAEGHPFESLPPDERQRRILGALGDQHVSDVARSDLP